MPRAVLTKDFWSGLLFMGMGAAALILGSDLRVGTAARMGPGFVPRAIGSRLYSDTMGRIAFALFLVFSMPIGIHHLFADPEVGAGFKFVHAAMTAMVSLPTLLTVFTIVAFRLYRRVGGSTTPMMSSSSARLRPVAVTASGTP